MEAAVGKGSVRPLHGLILVQAVEDEELVTDAGIALPSCVTTGNLSTGIVLRVGPRVPATLWGTEHELRAGTRVLFHPQAEVPLELGGDRILLPFEAIAAVVDVSTEVPPPETTRFFKLHDWETFIGDDHSNWEAYSNLTLFSLKVDFLEPFTDVEPLGRRLHECCVDGVRDLEDLDLRSVKYQASEKHLLTHVADDVWHGAFILSKEDSFVEFQRQRTDLRGIHLVAPRLLSAFSNALESQEFLAVAGDAYERVTCVVIRFHQRIRVEGRKTTLVEAKNSELMQQFLLFGKQETPGATLDALALKPSEVGRIDMKVSFQKVIADHEYRVFLNVQAPANEEHSILEVEWEIQDHGPGFLPNREYGPVLETFFRDIVIRSFYRRWFKENDDVVCTTVRESPAT